MPAQCHARAICIYSVSCCWSCGAHSTAGRLALGTQQCGVVWCGVVWCGVVWCGVVWCGVVWCGVVWCGVVWCGVVRCGVVWCGVLAQQQHGALSLQCLYTQHCRHWACSTVLCHAVACWRSALTAVVWQRAQQVGLAAGAGRSQQATRPGIARAGAHQHAAQVSGPRAAAAPWQLKGRRLAAPVLPRGGDCSPLERSPGARGPGGTAVGAQLRGLDGWGREL